MKEIASIQSKLRVLREDETTHEQSLSDFQNESNINLEAYFGENLWRELHERAKELRGTLLKHLEHCLTENYQQGLASGHFKSLEAPSPSLNNFIEGLSIQNLLVALCLIEEEQYFLLKPQLRVLASTVRDQVKKRKLLSAFYSDNAPNKNSALPNSPSRENLSRNNAVRADLIAPINNILVNQTKPHERIREELHRVKLNGLNKRTKGNFRNIFSEIEKKCENYSEIIDNIENLEAFKTKDYLAVAERNIIQLHPKIVQNFLIFACYIQAALPNSTECHELTELLVEICVNPIDQVRILDLVYILLLLIQDNQLSKVAKKYPVLDICSQQSINIQQYLIDFLVHVSKALKSQLFIAPDFSKIISQVQLRCEPLPCKADFVECLLYKKSATNMKLYLHEVIKLVKLSWTSDSWEERVSELLVRTCLGLLKKQQAMKYQFQMLESYHLFYDSDNFKFSLHVTTLLSENMKRIGDQPDTYLFALKNNYFLKVFEGEIKKVISLFAYMNGSLELLMLQKNKPMEHGFSNFKENLQLCRNEQRFVDGISVSLYYFDRLAHYLQGITAGVSTLTHKLDAGLQERAEVLIQIEDELKRIASEPLVVDLYRWSKDTLLYYADLKKDLKVLDSMILQALGDKTIQAKRYSSLRGIFNFIVQVLDFCRKRRAFSDVLLRILPQVNRDTLDTGKFISMSILDSTNSPAARTNQKSFDHEVSKVSINGTHANVEARTLDELHVEEAFANFPSTTKVLISEMFTNDINALDAMTIEPIMIVPRLFSFSTKKEMIK